MLWRSGRRSDNVEDRRDEQPAGGGLRVRGGLGAVGTIVVLLVAMYFGVDPQVVLNTVGGPGPAQPVASRSAAENELADFVAVVLADTEDTWRAIFRSGGREYREPRLVLYRGAVQSACGLGQAAMGPFYCPPDQKLYIDLGFYRVMRERLGAPGDFAQAYVIAHEVGHHVQTLLGITRRTQALAARQGETAGNRLSVRQELQADCMAGVWAHHADRVRGIVEAGDIEEALNAAAAVGDDRLQGGATGRVRPESFTHGTSAQRARWFRAGFQAGSLAACDTFSAASL
jgi:predicted metalloprotease